MATSILKAERYITSSIAPLRALSYRNVMSELWYPDGFPLTFCSLWSWTTNVYDAASLYVNRNTALVTFRENLSNHFTHLSFCCSLHTAFIPCSHCLRLHAHPSLILFSLAIFWNAPHSTYYSCSQWLASIQTKCFLHPQNWCRQSSRAAEIINGAQELQLLNIWS